MSGITKLYCVPMRKWFSMIDYSANFSPSRRVVLLSVVLLTACGRKGPLYLPDDPDEKKKPKKALAGESRAAD